MTRRAALAEMQARGCPLGFRPSFRPSKSQSGRTHAVPFGEHTRPRVSRPAPSPAGAGLAAVTEGLAAQALPANRARRAAPGYPPRSPQSGCPFITCCAAVAYDDRRLKPSSRPADWAARPQTFSQVPPLPLHYPSRPTPEVQIEPPVWVWSGSGEARTGLAQLKKPPQPHVPASCLYSVASSSTSRQLTPVTTPSPHRILPVTTPYIQFEYTVWSRGGYGVVTVW